MKEKGLWHQAIQNLRGRRQGIVERNLEPQHNGMLQIISSILRQQLKVRRLGARSREYQLEEAVPMSVIYKN